MTVDHLTPELFELAQRHLVTKALSEFSHERLLSPQPHGDRWRLTSPAGDTTYTFVARRHALEHWSVDPATVVREIKDEPAPLDAQQLVVEFAESLGIPDALLATYVEELASTLASTAWKLHHRAIPVSDLVDADHQTIEAAMTEGHPAFVANNGRLGFGIDDYEQWAPETGRTTRLVWVAARRSLTHLSLGAGLTEETLYDAELGANDRERFNGVLTRLGLDPADYLLLPVHPWQWRQKITVTFAPDVARRDLVLLGEGTDEMAPQQSIRTFANRSEPWRSFVKTALAIQNMGFVRGLSPAYMTHTPAINDWVHELVAGDETLRECGFSVLRERAAIGYTGDAFHALGSTSPQRKMIAALWRESAQPRLGDGERLMTMAALLHRDHERASLVTALVEASGLEPAAWLAAYLRVYVRPVVHCLLAHDLAYMPHGENLILVLQDHVPVRAVMKDIGEEVALMRPEAEVPEDVARICVDVPAEVKPLALHTDVFDGFLRHLAAILHDEGVLGEAEFWQLVSECVADHAADHPELAAAAAAYDFFTPEFAHSCLNRLQLRNTLQMVDLSDQAESLIYAGSLANPIAPAG
ncbi:MAG: IucA/IucC family siderophore biosynthesis protein [Nocardioides sp.]|nr:IucA/IucC family siderophore biosynthesis protein [Nocardioides sp.]